MRMAVYRVSGGINVDLGATHNGTGRIVKEIYLIVLCVCGLTTWIRLVRT
jgi:hypothetical protein